MEGNYEWTLVRCFILILFIPVICLQPAHMKSTNRVLNQLQTAPSKVKMFHLTIIF